VANNVFDLAELRKLIDEQASASPPPPEETPVEHEALTFPPVLLASDEELAALVDAAVAETGASERRQMGEVMSALMPKLGGRADGKRVSTAVRGRLGS
jgi:Glu-tRNA(Gln) amidotransferase subunit E-like FAD-binding protein